MADRLPAGGAARPRPRRRAQLLESRSEATEESMDEFDDRDVTAMATPLSRTGAVRARNLSTRELVAEITGKASLLVKKEVELARNELKADLQAELAMAKALAAGALAALLGLNVLLVAVVFALAIIMPGWLAALIVGGALLLIGAIVGYVGW